MRIEIKGVTASYGPEMALRGVSLSVADGEFLALLGPSASGKSTLLHAIAGLKAAGGSIQLDGRAVGDITPRDRGIGMVFQDLALWPHLTVERHLRFVLDGAKVLRAEQEPRIREILDVVELGAAMGRLPSQLSGGEAQRLAVARALVSRPKALLLDEPLGALDRRLRDKMIRLLADIHARYRMTTVLVTHDYDEALALAGRVAVLHEGRLLQSGSPDEVYRRPSDTVVAELTGAVSLVTGTREGDRVRLPWGSFVSEGAAGSVRVVLRPQDVEVVDGSGIVTAARFRSGRWEAEVQIGDARIWGWSASRRSPGSSAGVRLTEPLWSIA